MIALRKNHMEPDQDFPDTQKKVVDLTFQDNGQNQEDAHQGNGDPILGQEYQLRDMISKSSSSSIIILCLKWIILWTSFKVTAMPVHNSKKSSMILVYD